jgi:cell division protein FtsI (penicillin-binding protein 3)
VILGKILYVQIPLHDKYTAEYKADYMRDVQVPEKRGNIYSIESESKDTLLFATDVLRYDIYIDLGKNAEGEMNIPDTITISKKKDKQSKVFLFKKELNGLCDSLAKLFPEKTKTEYLQYFNKNRKKLNRGTLIAKDVSISQYDRMKSFPLFRHYWSGGITAKKEHYKRVYPYSDMNKMARRTIGTWVSAIGLYDGITGFYDSTILRKSYIIPSQKIAKGLYDKKMANDEPADIITTIDVSLQELADYSLEKCLRQNDATSGCVVLMDVNTGYIRAISNLKIDSSGQFRETENIALTHLMQPGSTFKTLSAMILLDKGLAKMTDTVPKGKRWFPNTAKPIEDDGGAKEGAYTLAEALIHSSNVGISSLVYKNYVEPKKRMQFISDLKQYFWFDSTLRLDYQFIYSNRSGKHYVSQEHTAYIPKVATSVDDILRLSYGYVSMSTPLQMLTFYNAIANNGVMIKPMLVSHIIRNVDGKREVVALKPDTLKWQICKSETITELQDVLKRVVEEGTAKVVRASYGVAGKTGTAEDIKTKLNQSSFVGYFPADAPKYSCIVVIYATKKHAGEVACPVFKDLADRVMGTKETFADKTNTKSSPASTNLNFKETKAISQTIIEKSKKENVVPYVVGKTAKEAMYILGNLGLKTTIEGKGRVVSQSIAKGTSLKAATVIHLKLQ